MIAKINNNQLAGQNKKKVGIIYNVTPIHALEIVEALCLTGEVAQKLIKSKD